MVKNLTHACLLAVFYFIPVVAWAQSLGYGRSNDDATLKLVRIPRDIVGCCCGDLSYNKRDSMLVLETQ